MPTQQNQAEDRKLKLSLWWVSNKLQLRKAGRVALMVLAGIPWLFFIIYLVIFLSNFGRNNRILEEMAAVQVISDNIIKPQAITVQKPKPFETNPGMYDVFGEIVNYNENYAASFTYSFTVGAKTTEVKTGYIAPGESKYLSEININVGAARITSANISVENVEWQRIVHPEELPQLDFVFQDLTYSIVELAQGGEDVQSEVTGTVVNYSAWGYDQVEVVVVIYFNDLPVAVKSATLQQFFSGAEKSLKFVWPKKYPYLSEVRAEAYTNVLDQGNLILP